MKSAFRGQNSCRKESLLSGWWRYLDHGKNVPIPIVCCEECFSTPSIVLRLFPPLRPLPCRAKQVCRRSAQTFYLSESHQEHHESPIWKDILGRSGLPQCGCQFWWNGPLSSFERESIFSLSSMDSPLRDRLRVLGQACESCRRERCVKSSFAES